MSARILSALTLAATLLLPATQASAGDFAKVDVLGFSASGDHFAFEEYGIQDGSGFPYSNIYVIDTARDSWVRGSPFRRLDEIDDSVPVDFDAELARTRAANAHTARQTLAASDIAGHGRTVGHNPPTELSANPHEMLVLPRMIAPTSDTPLRLTLEEIAVPAQSECPSGFGEVRGFRLLLTDQAGTRVLNEDRRVPTSRGCPLRYRIERVITHHPQAGSPRFAVLIQMETIGFEGPNGRFLAITGAL